MWNPSRKRPDRRPGGFTLIELMVVIAIIAVLAAILLPSFTRARSLAQFNACKQNIRNIAAAIDMYRTDNGGYLPASSSQDGGFVNSSCRLVTQGYLGKVPVCPAAGPAGVYVFAGFTVAPDGTLLGLSKVPTARYGINDATSTGPGRFHTAVVGNQIGPVYYSTRGITDTFEGFY